MSINMELLLRKLINEIARVWFASHKCGVPWVAVDSQARALVEVVWFRA